MNKDILVAFLHSSNLITMSAAKEIADHFTYKSLAKNQFQLTEGKICDEYLFLEKGYMRGFAHDIDGNEVTTAFCSAGQLAFEVSSFFNRIRSKENIQALTDCEGWYITYEQLNQLFHASPDFREFGRSVLVKGYTQLKTRMLMQITETAEERYSFLLTNYPHIFQHAALKHIASFLGITDTSLSRIRKELSKK
ncbi:Crp/Fnr family transcriptional regulator [Mucilaginibacter sp. CAU 1740]|uniref:Crp/Fnr family transcriptional regulator n=1 Tax=Mucilaginibacter sp. CAU 1740 TaxID=3140365 RepID=UPI00325B4405